MKLQVKLYTIILTAFLALTSCKKENTKTVNNDEYYIKYNIRGNGTYSYFNEFSVNSDKGLVSFKGYQYKTWNQTYGPVKSDFNASASVKASNVTVEIYVSKNNGPFALKASKVGNSLQTTNTSLSYTIDF